ncbi:MAG: FAD-dependent oxidoreductase [Ramlibacter sp.]|nr:FAD-dependent oxidoreductase [Ramlibacter sp.]
MTAAAPCVVRTGRPPDGSPHVPDAIVGSGACGLAAALTLADAGIECVVLERDAAPAGSTALSSGFIPAPCTRVQMARGIQDSAAQFEADIQAKAHDTAAPYLATAYAQAIGPALDALEREHGLQFELLEGFLYPGHSALRMHAVPERTGAALMSGLQRAADAANVTVMTEALVRELWVDETGQVTGLGFLRRGGQMERLTCDAVLLACNGFGGNRELVRELLPEMAGATFAGHTGNDGSAIAWGRALGARLADLGGYQGHGSWAVPQGVLVSWALMMEGAIQVNREGQRFHDETQGYSEAAVHVLAQPGGLAWNVFDDQLLDFAQQFPDFRDAQGAGAVHHAGDVDALAALIGCNAAALRTTLDGVSATAAASDGRRFKRALASPYHAVKVTGALFHTQGGLDIDAHCRVLRQDGSPWRNLLAAGGAARGVSGNAVWGYLSGNGLLSAVAGGAIAARTITQFLASRTTT